MSRIPELAGKGRRRFQRDEIVVRLGRRGPDLRGRVLGGALVRVQPEAAGPLPDRGQRLRDLGSRSRSTRRAARSRSSSARSRTSSSPRCDGCDFLESYDALRYAAEYCRARKGPALVHAHVIRPYSHSLSDDEAQLPAEGGARARARARPGPRALAAPARRGDRLGRGPREAPRGGRRRDQRGRGPGARRRAARSRSRPTSSSTRRTSTRRPPRSRRSPSFAEGAAPTTMVDLLNACLKDEMKRDPRDRRLRRGRRRRLARGGARRVQGQGRRLQGHRGAPAALRRERVFNSPLAEANIVGRAIGMAVRGLEAGRRDPVLRLHLAGVHADPQRALEHAVALGQRVLLPGRRARRDRRLHRRAARSTTRSRAPC